MTVRGESGLTLFQGGETADALMRENEKTAEYGLMLTRAQAVALLQVHRTALERMGRVEFRGGAVSRLIDAFCDSPYIPKDEYAETLCTLIELFYTLKNETEIGDERLIARMRQAYDAACGAIEGMEDDLLNSTNGEW